MVFYFYRLAKIVFVQSSQWSIIFRRFFMGREKDLLAVSCPPVCPSVRTYQRGSHWKDFREIWYLGLLWISGRWIPNLVEIGQRYRARLHEDLSRCHCCLRQEFAIKGLLCNNQLFFIFCYCNQQMHNYNIKIHIKTVSLCNLCVDYTKRLLWYVILWY